MRIYEFLADSVRRFPNKTAVVHHGRRITYAALYAQAERFAGVLARHGVKRGDRVILYAENSIEYVVAYFGILKAGAVVVAVNTQMVAREAGFIIGDCAPALIVTETSRTGAVTAALALLPVKPPVVAVTIADDPRPDCAAPPATTDQDLACIIYTSGTTGKPKGVMLTHANIAANTESIVAYLGLRSTDSVMVVLPFYYSYGHSLLTTHIKAGGTLVIDNRFLYPNTILETMEQEKVTGFAGVPSHYAILVRKSALAQYPLRCLRYVTQAGGAMSPDMIREFRSIVPHAAFYVMYGQTEASARLSYLPPEHLDMKYGSIGRGIPGVDLAVVDDTGRPVRPGETGEIIARGANIMAGYWQSPSETAHVLRDGWLYTGDLARVDEDGFIYIVSRKKDMIKSGAHRISPIEIEDVVAAMPGVLECAVVGVPDDILGEAIMLCVVPTDENRLDVEAVMRFCRERIASFKMPRKIRIMPSLPKTASGKVKRGELRAVGGERL